MKRRLPAIILFLMLFSVLAFQSVFAEDGDIASGNYEGADWRITSEGELIIGAEDEIQYLNVPLDLTGIWHDYAAEIRSASFRGNVIGQNLHGLFCECPNLTSVDFSGLDTSNATNLGRMFSECISLSELDLSGFDTSNVTNMAYMFYGCSSLTGLDLSRFDTGNVTNMFYMFYGCSSITELDLSGFNTGKVTSMGNMFKECSSLSYLDISGFDMSNLPENLDSAQLLYNCSSLKTIKTPLLLTFYINLPYPMYDSKGNEYDYLPQNTTNSFYLYAENPTAGDIASGNLDGLDWRISSEGELILGNEGETQYLNTPASGQFPWYDNAEVKTASFRGNVVGQDLSDLFHYCTALTSVDFTGLDTSNVTNMTRMFMGCSALTELDLSGFNTGNVTSMTAMFSGCTVLANLDLSGFDTSNVTDMSYMFDSCNGLANLNLSGFDTKKVTSMGDMFYNCRSLTQLNLTSFDTSNVTSMLHMFYNCKALNSLNLSSFVTSNVTDMSYMFYNCSDLTALNLSSFDMSNVTSVSNMLQNCSDLQTLKAPLNVTKDIKLPFTMYGAGGSEYSSLPTNLTNSIVLYNSSESAGIAAGNFNGLDWRITSEGELIIGAEGETQYLDTTNIQRPWRDYINEVKTARFDGTVICKDINGLFSSCKNMTSVDFTGFDTSQCTDMMNMFNGCSALTTLDVSGFDTSNVRSMGDMFAGCSSLTDLDVSGFDTSNVYSMYGMFSGCSALTTLDVSKFDTGKVGDMRYMFRDCKALTTLDVSGFDTGKVDDMRYMFYDCRSLTTLNVSGFDTSKVTDMSWMFYGCSSLKSLNCSGFNTSNVTNMNSMFAYCSSLPELDVSRFDTSKVTVMFAMFQGCNSVLELDVTRFDTSNVTGMRFMFSGCSTVTNLNVTGFDISNITSLYGMFSGCKSLTALDLSSFDTSNVTDMGGMFEGCSTLTNLDVSRFDTSKVTEMNSMFSGCSALTALDVSKFDTSNVTVMHDMFSRCSALTTLDLSGFDTSNVTEMQFMFSGCSALTNLNFSGFDTSNVTDMDRMFENCTSFTALNLSSFDMSKVTDTFCMLQGCSSLKTLNTPKNVTLDTGLPFTMYDSEGNEYKLLPKNLASSIKLYNQVPEFPDVDIVSTEFVESDRARETDYGTPFRALFGDKVVVKLSDGNTVTFTHYNGEDSEWTVTATGEVPSDSYMSAEYGRRGHDDEFYDVMVGDVIKDCYVNYSGIVNGVSFEGSHDLTTTITDCGYIKRINNIVYTLVGENAWAYAYSEVSDFSGEIKFPEYVDFYSGENAKRASTIVLRQFSDLPALKSIKIPANVVQIDPDCFVNTGLTEVTIPASVKNVYGHALGFKRSASGEYTKVDGFTIRGYKGTAAETYANENGFTFIEITDDPTPDDPTPEPVSIVGASVTNIVTKTRTGRAITQSPVVKLKGVTLKNGVDYTLSYKNNINASTAAYVTITGKGGYTGSITRKFTIQPLVPALNFKSVTKGSKSFTAKWPKASAAVQKQFTGYQIQYSTSKTFASGTKVKSTTQRSAKKVVIRKLKKKKNYYVRIRRYLKWNGQMVYSNWSAVKKVKTK